jgi:hypothetical protein
MCAVSGNETGNCGSTESDYVPESYTASYALLMLGNVLLGIGASPMFTIGLSYIDENCKAKLTAFYISKFIYELRMIAIPQKENIQFKKTTRYKLYTVLIFFLTKLEKNFKSHYLYFKSGYLYTYR